MSARRALCAVVVGLLLLGCRQEATLPSVNVTWTLTPEPPKVGRAELAFAIADRSGGVVPGARCRLEANMSHAGMQPVFAEAVETAPGKYRAEFEFTMAGDWFIDLEGHLKDGSKVAYRVPVSGVRKR